jgi:hypothetical protein
MVRWWHALHARRVGVRRGPLAAPKLAGRMHARPVCCVFVLVALLAGDGGTELHLCAFLAGDGGTELHLRAHLAHLAGVGGTEVLMRALLRSAVATRSFFVAMRWADGQLTMVGGRFDRWRTVLTVCGLRWPFILSAFVFEADNSAWGSAHTSAALAVQCALGSGLPPLVLDLQLAARLIVSLMHAAVAAVSVLVYSFSCLRALCLLASPFTCVHALDWRGLFGPSQVHFDVMLGACDWCLCTLSRSVIKSIHSGKATPSL